MATKEEYPSRFYKSIVWSFKTQEIKQLFTLLLESALENGIYVIGNFFQGYLFSFRDGL